MKKIISIIVLGFLILNVFGAGALISEKEQINFEINDYEKPTKNIGSRDYTHTVLVEVGTATYCPSCPASNLAWHNIYGSGNYDFEYCEMVIDRNSVANVHMNNNYNLYWVPTSYWDGGQFVYPGTNTGTFYANLNSAGARTVPDLVAELNIEWLGNAQIEISYDLTNNEALEYPGHLRVYILELESTLWNDYNGNPYYHAFLDFAFNEAIIIPAGETISDNTIWDGVSSGYPNIDEGNIQVILSVFDDESHQAYSDPPTGAPFLAYYVDETVSAFFPMPPFEPDNPDPYDGETGVDLDANLYWDGGDPNPGDEVTYDVYFGTTNPPTLVESGHTNTNYEPGTMDYETTYYWQIISWDSQGESTEGDIWEFSTLQNPNQAPDEPEINGPNSGEPNIEYLYRFSATDTNEDQVFFYIDWGDESFEEWIGPYNSGQIATEHIVGLKKEHMRLELKQRMSMVRKATGQH